MFEVGKKYRYTGKGNTNFNSKGFMDYLKEGEHEVKNVEFNLGVFSDKPYVRFSDEPTQNGWFLDPMDFEEVEEITVILNGCTEPKYFTSIQQLVKWAVNIL